MCGNSIYCPAVKQNTGVLFMKSLAVALCCISLAILLGGCFVVEGVVFDPAKGEIIPLNTEKLICKQGVLFGELKDRRGEYPAELVYTSNNAGTSYDLTQVFEKAVSEDQPPESWTKRRATMHRLADGLYASVEVSGKGQLISLMKVDDRSLAFVMPANEDLFEDIARRLNIGHHGFPDADPRIGLSGSPESIRIFFTELATVGMKFATYIECRTS